MSAHPYTYAVPHGGAPPDPPELPPGADPSPPWPWWYALAAYFGGFVVAAVLAIPFVVGLDAAGADEPAPTVAGTIVQNLALIGVAVALAWRTRRPKAWHFGLRRTRFWPALGWTALGLVAFFIAAIAYSALIDPEVEQTTLDDLNARETALATIATAVLVCVVAPVGEEIFFRGFIYRSLRGSLNVWLAALIGGVLFGLVHLPTGPDAVPMLTILGVIFCLIYERTGSLYPVIGLHAFNNTIAVGVDIERWEYVAPIGGAVILACMVAPRFLHPRRALS